jgi:hypothetical protein
MKHIRLYEEYEDYLDPMARDMFVDFVEDEIIGTDRHFN